MRQLGCQVGSNQSHDNHHHHDNHININHQSSVTISKSPHPHPQPGGALYINGPRVSAHGLSIVDSFARNSGGCLAVYSSLSLADSSFLRCSAGSAGGAVVVASRDITLREELIATLEVRLCASPSSLALPPAAAACRWLSSPMYPSLPEPSRMMRRSWSFGAPIRTRASQLSAQRLRTSHSRSVHVQGQLRREARASDAPAFRLCMCRPRPDRTAVRTDYRQSGPLFPPAGAIAVLTANVTVRSSTFFDNSVARELIVALCPKPSPQLARNGAFLPSPPPAGIPPMALTRTE